MSKKPLRMTFWCPECNVRFEAFELDENAVCWRCRGEERPARPGNPGDINAQVRISVRLLHTATITRKDFPVKEDWLSFVAEVRAGNEPDDHWVYEHAAEDAIQSGHYDVDWVDVVDPKQEVSA